MSAAKRILVVDDEPDIREIVSLMLEDAGYEAFSTGTGEGVLDLVRKEHIDLVVLDLGLPGVDGLTLTRSLKEHVDVGVVIISGRGETTEKIIGLEIGADDYLSKPFEPRELLARIRSVLRRLGTAPARPAASGAYRFEGWTLDVLARALTGPGGDPVGLSSGEFGLLKAFAEHPNEVLSRDQLLDFTHGDDTPAFDRSVDVQIARLRKKIEADAQKPNLIKTVRNAGYIFAVKVERI
ncbi:MAG: response regulator transcription factor [Magnetovibrio sp.]|nr:response regulator transcription factor [Magnetovibrio sp.]